MSHTLVLPKVSVDDPRPKYLQARDILVDAIRSGRLTPGAKLPSTAELSTIFDISLITAQKALEGMVEAGWLRREVGRGTYVCDDLDVRKVDARPLTLALLFPPHVNIDDFYHSTLINGLRRVIRKSGRRVEYFFHDRFDASLKGRGDVCALCVHPPTDSAATILRLAQRTPTVLVGGLLPDVPAAAVDCDNEAGGRMALRHLLDLGHQRILMLSGPLNLTNSRDRLAGARAELREAGVELAPDATLVSKDSVVLDDETRAALLAALKARPKLRPTAIFAGGFYLALATLQAIRDIGLSVPDDISLVGFDDPPAAAHLSPALTTVRQPLEQMAAAAFELAVQAMQSGARLRERRILPADLVVRDSTQSPCD